MSATFQPETAPPAKSGSGIKIVLIVFGIIMLLGLLACGGLAALTYFGFSKGMEAAGEEFRKQLSGNPAIEAEIGELQTMTMRIMETAERTEQAGGGEPVIVFDAVGSNGTGKILVTPVQGGGNKISSAVLELPDGRQVPIPLGGSEEPMMDEGDVGDVGNIDIGDPLSEGDAGE